MITLLGSLLGFLSAALPEGFKIFRDKADRAHELAIMDRQIELQKAGGQQRLEEIYVEKDIAESQALYKTYNTNIRWVDALNGTVRPVLAYAFFLLYALTKYLQYRVISSDAPFSVYLDVLWNTEDQAIFAGIISFYFGQRAMCKARGKK